MAPAALPTPPPVTQPVRANGSSRSSRRRTTWVRMTRDEETALLNICVNKGGLYGTIGITQFWDEVTKAFSEYAGRPYSHTSARRRVEAFVKARRDKLKEECKEEGGDEEYTRLLDAWIKIVDTEDEKKSAAMLEKRKRENGIREAMLERERIKNMIANGETPQYTSTEGEDSDSDRSLHEGLSASPPPTASVSRTSTKRRRVDRPSDERNMVSAAIAQLSDAVVMGMSQDSDKSRLEGQEKLAPQAVHDEQAQREATLAVARAEWEEIKKMVAQELERTRQEITQQCERIRNDVQQEFELARNTIYRELQAHFEQARKDLRGMQGG
ncbi:hypothetical protein FQN52_002203 [Onygenales sp. PD_12]|nr:hypothetical protein FQN52_002203 [Onygenales sp. PD_12]